MWDVPGRALEVLCLKTPPKFYCMRKRRFSKENQLPVEHRGLWGREVKTAPPHGCPADTEPSKQTNLTLTPVFPWDPRLYTDPSSTTEMLTSYASTGSPLLFFQSTMFLLLCSCSWFVGAGVWHNSMTQALFPLPYFWAFLSSLMYCIFRTWSDWCHPNKNINFSVSKLCYPTG